MSAEPSVAHPPSISARLGSEILVERVRAERAAAAAPVAVDPVDLRPEPTTLRWLRARTGHPVYARSFEQASATRLGPDLLGRRRPAPVPVPTDEDLGAALAELAAWTSTGGEQPVRTQPGGAAALLHRISLTRQVGVAPVAALGRIAVGRRSPAARRWGHRMGAPKLPELTEIPRTVHVVQLGAATAADAAVRHEVARLRSRTAAEIDVVVWTDLRREQVVAAAEGAHGRRADGVRATLDWARAAGVALVSIEEVFHAGNPMVLGQEYAAERSTRLNSGSAEASRYLALDILLRFGGAWAAVGAGALSALGPSADAAGPTALFDAVAASLPGFTLDRDPAEQPRGLVVLAPAGHPAIRLWQELVRVSYTRSEDRFGGARVDPLSRRAAWVVARLVERLGPAEAELVRPVVLRPAVPAAAGPGTVAVSGHLARPVSELVSKAAPVHEPTPGTALDAAEDPAAVVGDLLSAGLLWAACRNRNLYLTALEPVVAACPDPEAAWSALLTVWVESAAAGRTLPITSITDARRIDPGRVHQVRLPDAVRAMLDRRPLPEGWFGAELAAGRPGRPVWLQHERVAPARFRVPVPSGVRLTPVGGAQLELRRRLALAHRRRLDASQRLLVHLKPLLCQDDPDGRRFRTGVRPTVEVRPWVRRLTGLAVGAPGFERGLRRRLGADLFGRWTPGPTGRTAPAGTDRLVAELVAVTGTFDVARVVPDRVAPVLRSLSLTRCTAQGRVGDAEDLQIPAPVAASRRDAGARRSWSRDEAATHLPEPVLLPRVVHAIWLGGPQPDQEFAGSLAAAAREYRGRLDFVLWTDITREAARAAVEGGTTAQDGLVRATLDWAREHRISVLDWREVFDDEHPALAHEQILAQQLITAQPGHLAPSALLRLEVIARYGGIYVDPGLDLVGAARQVPDLDRLVDEVASSATGFAADTRTGADGLRQVIVAPAGHPAVGLWQEILRLNHALREPQLVGGAEPMSERYAVLPADRRWRRDPEVLRVHRADAMTRRMIADCGMVRVLTDTRPGPHPAPIHSAPIHPAWIHPAPPRPTWTRSVPPDAGCDELTGQVQEILIVLLRQLEVRSGDLHLTRVAPLVARTADPEAVWIAVLRFVADGGERGRLPTVTSVTRFRWNDEGEPEYVGLPPEAEMLLEYGRPARTWLGAGLSVAGSPVWVMDEFVVPAGLGCLPSPQNGLNAQAAQGMIGGLLVPDGFAGVTLTGRAGVLWHAERRVRPQDVAGRLADLGLLGRPVWLQVDAEPQHGAAFFADRLAQLLGVGVTLVGAAARVGRSPGSGPRAAGEPGTRDPGVLLAGLTARAGAGGPSRRSPVPVPAAIRDWLRTLIDDRLYEPDFEAEGDRISGPDLFGLTDRVLGTGAVPRPGAGVLGELAGAGADLVAPLLRRISLTAATDAAAIDAAAATDAAATGGTDAAADRPESLAEALAAVRAGTDRGRVSARDLDPIERQWGHPQAPGLPERISIPHVVHAIWLGGPVPEEGVYRRNIGAGADRWAGQVDVVLWSDLTRAEVTRAEQGGGGARDEQIRSTLRWARQHRISVVNLFEVFGPDTPMVCGREFVREYVKDLPRGYAAASDILRLEIVGELGGVYTDGDNSFDATDLDPLPNLFEEIVAGEPMFTVDYLGQGRINNDIVAGPAGHPAWWVFRETTRVNFRLTQRQLLGGPDRMSQHFAGQQVELMRYSTVRRTGRCHHLALHRLGYDAQDPRPVHPGRMIRHGSELSWGRPPAPRPVRTGQDVLDRLERVVTTLARQLVNRDGDLYLVEVAQVVEALPDPDAAWQAVLRFLAAAQADGRIARVRSVTDIRRDNDDVVRHVLLPPAAQALLRLLRPEQVEGSWLGDGTRDPGAPAWIQDELVSPAVLLAPDETPLARAATVARPITDPAARVVGLDLTGAAPAPTGWIPPGWTGVRTAARWGEPTLSGTGVREGELLDALRAWPELLGRPLVLLPDGGSGGLGGGFANRLAALSGQPVTVLEPRREPSHPIRP